MLANLGSARELHHSLLILASFGLLGLSMADKSKKLRNFESDSVRLLRGHR